MSVWIARERAHKSIVPEAFWYISLVGGAMLVIYGIHRAIRLLLGSLLASLFLAGIYI
ncbi:lipid-A-disaccharide synthase N-terminal domain-containing protein [Microbulbifer sp. CnH-101-G]|uniref:lipid-A-disaccharide synthase N-terminal domain-containing protein n=1 Tax=Microbulbifer sp. CnH-101-G TaxID=3243393 RepID=UPI00403A7652